MINAAAAVGAAAAAAASRSAADAPPPAPRRADNGNRTAGLDILPYEVKGSVQWPTISGLEGYRLAFNDSVVRFDTSRCTPEFTQARAAAVGWCGGRVRRDAVVGAYAMHALPLPSSPSEEAPSEEAP